MKPSLFFTGKASNPHVDVLAGRAPPPLQGRGHRRDIAAEGILFRRYHGRAGERTGTEARASGGQKKANLLGKEEKQQLLEKSLLERGSPAIQLWGPRLPFPPPPTGAGDEA